MTWRVYPEYMTSCLRLALFLTKMFGYCFSFVSNLRVKLERHPRRYAESNDIKGKVVVPEVKVSVIQGIAQVILDICTRRGLC
jgi:hypothetical protein